MYLQLNLDIHCKKYFGILEVSWKLHHWFFNVFKNFYILNLKKDKIKITLQVWPYFSFIWLKNT